MRIRRFIEAGPMQALALGLVGGLCLIVIGVWTITAASAVRAIIGGTLLAIGGAIFFGFSVFVLYKRRPRAGIYPP